MAEISKTEGAPSETTNNLSNTPSNTVPMRALSKELYNTLLRYLDKQSHADVRDLIDSLSNAPSVNVTFSSTPTAN